MKIAITIILVLCSTQFSIAQTSDSTNFVSIRTVGFYNDSIAQISLRIQDSLFGPFTAMGPDHFYEFVPTCSCLNLKDGQFYKDTDSIPYQGACIVTNAGGVDSYYYKRDKFDYSSTCNIRGFSGLNIFEPSNYIKIISHYNDGKRHGNREYFDKNGNLMKTEKYENGILIETTYP